MREKRPLSKARLLQDNGHNNNRIQATITRYGRLIFALAIVAMASQYASRIFSFFAHSHEGDHLTIFFIIAVMFAMSFVMFHLANGTVLPSFVLAVIFGMAAIIPVIRRLRFHNRALKDIIISESAVTDATGTLLTLAILSAIGSNLPIGNVVDGYRTIFSAEIGLQLGRQLAFGVLFGVCGYFLLETLTSLRTSHDREHEADAAFFLFIPIIIFTLALALGGSGYLAAFIAGLMFNLNETLHETERFFNHIVHSGNRRDSGGLAGNDCEHGFTGYGRFGCSGFVGQKMLDFRLKEIKTLPLPMYFME